MTSRETLSSQPPSDRSLTITAAFGRLADAAANAGKNDLAARYARRSEVLARRPSNEVRRDMLGALAMAAGSVDPELCVSLERASEAIQHAIEEAHQGQGVVIFIPMGERAPRPARSHPYREGWRRLAQRDFDEAKHLAELIEDAGRKAWAICGCAEAALLRRCFAPLGGSGVIPRFDDLIATSLTTPRR